MLYSPATSSAAPRTTIEYLPETEGTSILLASSPRLYVTGSDVARVSSLPNASTRCTWKFTSLAASTVTHARSLAKGHTELSTSHNSVMYDRSALASAAVTVKAKLPPPTVPFVESATAPNHTST